MMSSSGICASCKRNIDEMAKLCPYCGADPSTGERLDTQAILQEVFRPKEITTSDSVMEFARQRQGVVIVVTALVALIAMAAVHQFVTARNRSAVTDAPAVPLTEITDVTRSIDDATPVPMPELDFQYSGRPQTMRTYVAEQGAITPPEVVAAQQPAAPQPGSQPAARQPVAQQQPRPVAPAPPQPRPQPR
jgi:hypothetical protein